MDCELTNGRTPYDEFSTQDGKLEELLTKLRKEAIKTNKKYADIWPNITLKKDAPADADDFLKQTDKFDKFFSEAPGEGD